MLAEKDVARFEKAQNEVECAAWLEHFRPDLVVIDTDDAPVLPSWLIGLCLARGTPVLVLSSHREANTGDPMVVVLHKPYMRQQARVAIEAVLALCTAKPHAAPPAASPKLQYHAS